MEDYLIDQFKTMPFVLIVVIGLILYCHRTFVSKDKLRDKIERLDEIFELNLKSINSQLKEIKAQLNTLNGLKS